MNKQTIDQILNDPIFRMIDAEETIKELNHVLFLVTAPLEMLIKDMGNNTNPTKEAAIDALKLIQSKLS